MSIRIAKHALAATLLIVAAAILPAQDTNGAGDLPIESDWEGVRPTLYGRGDQTFVISLGPIFPMVFLGESGTIDANLSVGGTGSLNYNYFITPNLSLGGELGGMFAGTLGGNMLYIMPFGFRISYQFLAGRFEFPLSLSFGGALQTYLAEDYFGLFLKPGAAAFWRFSPDWSFGLNAAWWWVPQWVGERGKDVHGNFLELTLAARYHF